MGERRVKYVCVPVSPLGKVKFACKSPKQKLVLMYCNLRVMINAATLSIYSSEQIIRTTCTRYSTPIIMQAIMIHLAQLMYMKHALLVPSSKHVTLVLLQCIIDIEACTPLPFLRYIMCQACLFSICHGGYIYGHV